VHAANRKQVKTTFLWSVLFVLNHIVIVVKIVLLVHIFWYAGFGISYARFVVTVVIRRNRMNSIALGA